MIFPEKPTVHGESGRLGTHHWRERESRADMPYDYPYRTCSYCGSIHPEDLLKFLQQGATLHGADWKYGWPHKFYVEGIPNPKAGQEVELSATWQGGQKIASRLGPAPAHTPAKWYNEHLMDLGYDDETIGALLEALSQHSGIRWFKNEEGKIMYESPCHGYQKA